MIVVVVESPAKAKTINKYLGKDYVVVASYGHVRDLPAKDGSVRPEEDFAMSWQVDSGSEKHIRAIASALKKADRLCLATDPDREGEAISWHVLAAPQGARRPRQGVEVKRVVFNEITKDAVLDAMAHPRDVNRALVEAYLARRALDYLVGFTLSPVLWRKLPGSRSAGRVQSVALRLVCEREAEIERFRPREYWTINVEFRSASGAVLTARLTHLKGTKLDKFALGDKVGADGAAAVLAGGEYRRPQGRAQAAAAPSQPALHHLDAPAGGLAQARLQREPHHARRPAPLRGHRAQRRKRRAHHLHAHGQRGPGRRGGRGQRAGSSSSSSARTISPPSRAATRRRPRTRRRRMRRSVRRTCSGGRRRSGAFSTTISASSTS